jgi:hypothetical protein
MNYMLLIAETQADFDKRGDPARAATLRGSLESLQ